LKLVLTRTGQPVRALKAESKLNPNDNQGIRYVLAGCLLRQDNDSALKELLTAHEDGGAFWLYTRALVAFRERGNGDEQAAALVKDAWSANEYVPAILAGSRGRLSQQILARMLS
jgi:hypothetical protein